MSRVSGAIGGNYDSMNLDEGEQSCFVIEKYQHLQQELS